MNKDVRQATGSEGEDTALAYLQSRGLRLLARNYHCRGGEIDLVMVDGQVLVFVEVRFRSYDHFGGAAASVDTRKQHRIALAARHMLMRRRDLARYRARFDVIAISPAASADKIEWIRDAFRLA